MSAAIVTSWIALGLLSGPFFLPRPHRSLGRADAAFLGLTLVLAGALFGPLGWLLHLTCWLEVGRPRFWWRWR